MAYTPLENWEQTVMRKREIPIDSWSFAVVYRDENMISNKSLVLRGMPQKKSTM